ncbi:hypothetical protein CFN78_10115 [Amycolatopsis antarctica]|uniref:OmpR/PhoB-type domain-containing protein n=1 Tax=Amycolatopsis antarctica TaxID=1854586 RepID=A0A263D726_9PSEU|nr:BTAD domain-containing putative transcriptional regulator [Amycolatopsis antarctica]OZM73215.1 hypothetical protein CFN78_10115 [Amycolatopsis antarctica]
MTESETDTPVGFWVLGPLQVRDARGEIVPVSADKPRRLLTELLLRRNAWVDTDVLVEALWGDARVPASARGNLKTYVHQLRQLLPGEGAASPISSRRGSYLLTTEHGQLDSDVFEALIAGGRARLDAGDARGATASYRQALDLWRGDPGRGEDNPVAEAAAARLRELRWSARDGLADALIADGGADQAVAMLRGAATEDPLREATAVRLVTALRDAGRPTEALTAYQEIRENLVRELGAEPGGALRELHTSLLADTRGGQPPAPRTVHPAPVTHPGLARQFHGRGIDAEAIAGGVGDNPEYDTGTRTSRRLASNRLDHESHRPRIVGRALVDEPEHRPHPSALRRGFSRRPVAIRAAAVVCALALLVVGAVFVVDRATTSDPMLAGSSNAAPGGQDLSGVAKKRAVPGYPADTTRPPSLLFGLGPEATVAQQQPLAGETPIGLYTTWYDGPEELARYASWKQQEIPQLYAEGKSLHLIVAPDLEKSPPGPVDTPFGPACGVEHLLSPGFLEDMTQLAQSFAGRAEDPPLYVSMFNGLLKLNCNDSVYEPDAPTKNYYRALSKRYLEVRQVFHQYAPNARVALNWDGWQASADQEAGGAGNSLMDQFTDALNASDFQSFNAFEDTDNAQDVSDMVRYLGRFGPVMVSNFGPYEAPDITRGDLDTVFEPGNLGRLTAEGLFAWSFWEQKYLDTAPDLYPKAKDIVTRYAR